MRKKLFFGLAAAALIALNVAAFSTTSHADPSQKRPDTGCYQTFSYCDEHGEQIMRHNCTTRRMASQCEKTTCIECRVMPAGGTVAANPGGIKPYRP